MVFLALCAGMMAQTVFVHANVFDGRRLLRNQTVVIEGGVVTGMGSRVARPAGAEIIDAKGKTLMPELIDSSQIVSKEWVPLVYDDGFAWGRKHPAPSFEALHEEVGKVHKEQKRALVEVGSLRESMEALNADADGLLRIFAGAESDPAFIKMAVKKKAFVIPMLAVLEGAASKSGKPRIEGSLEALRALHAAHVPLLAGGDVAKELELLVRDVGLTPIEALQAATSVPARVLGLEERGAIAVGRRVRVMLVEGDPTVSISVLTRGGSRVF